MNPGKTEEPCTHVPYIHTPVYQQTSCNQCLGFSQGGPITFLPEGTQSLPSMNMTSTQAPQPSPSTFNYYREALNSTQQYCMLSLSVGFFQGAPFQFQHEGTQSLSSVAMIGAQTLQPPPRSFECNRDMINGPQKDAKPAVPGSAGDLTACQLRNPSSSLPQGVSGASSKKPAEDALVKRELRLMKNREAARECRRKKKEYVKCLENRVAVLENQNKTLIEELRALKDIYRHKVE